MKIQNVTIIFICLLLLFSHINSLGNSYQEEIHDIAQFPKPYTLDDKNVVVIISVPGEQKSYEAKLDKNGETIYSYIPFNASYSPSADLIVPHSKDGNISDYLLFHHNKQNLPGAKHFDYITRFNQGKITSSKKDPQSKFYEKKSAVALKNGKVFLAGINTANPEGSETTIDAKLYDPKTNTFGSGISFEGVGKYVSCYELKENHVYCAYVIKQYPYVSKLKLKHLEINPTSNSIIPKGEQVIKTFYTVFNFLKAVPFNEKESIIVFRVGDGEINPKNGNSGKELFYYHLELSNEEALVSATRYDKLEAHCTYRKEEDDSIDIAVLSEKRIYIACEAEEGKLRGYIIYPGKTEITGFYFNKFEAKEIRNPVFAKFGKSLGIFYTYISEDNNYKVAFHIMNFPDCDDYYHNKIYLLPKHYAKSNFFFIGKVFMDNPYPASRMSEKVYARFNKYSNFTIINLGDGNKNIEPGVEYDPETLELKFISKGLEGIYSIEYTAIRIDELDGLIEGRTCSIKFNTPKCLDQCYSCTKLGTEEENECLGCKNESYYITYYNGAIDEGFGKPHNCLRCNESCYNCYDKFTLEPFPTTNCKKCDYDNGYYHLYNDTRTCISKETQEYWEYVYNHSMYLDQTPENDKTKWRWRYCHKNCHKCSGPGDDIDNNCDECKDGLYFFCNQTKGNGIPGTCHAECVNNGFYLKESEGFEKCCPCMDKCKVCKDELTCDDCYKPFYLSPNNDSCVEDCGYCYAKDNKTFEAWQCVDCKHRYAVEKYNLNGTCYDTIPKITYKDPDVFGKYHHVVDEKCNWLIGCKGGCFNCTPWYSEQCTTKCKPAFYKKDYHSILVKPKTFPCYTEKECQGLDKYQFGETEEIGGVPKNMSNEGGVCYNCLLREGNYRQVENNFTCGPRKKATWICIPSYNKLCKCFSRCDSCNEYGNGCRHNCLSCKDPSLYFLKKYVEDKPEGDCIRGHPKCGILPYYHDYDLAEELGLEEDCGQECDVCLENRTCTERYPFYVIETRECVEICGFNEIMAQTCVMDQTDSLKKLIDDIEEQKKYQELNSSANIAKYIQKIFLEKYAAHFNINISILEENINNYIGSGRIYNLPESQIIFGNNISIEITTNKLEIEKLNNILNELLRQTILEKPEEKKDDVKPLVIDPQINPITPKDPEDTHIIPPSNTGPSKEETQPITPPKKETQSIDTTNPKISSENNSNKESEDLPPMTIKNVSNENETSILDITECEKALKKAYNLSIEEDIVIIKENSLKELKDHISKNVEYHLFSMSLGKFLDLKYCSEISFNISYHLEPSLMKLPPLFQYKLNSVIENGYDPISYDSDFFNDICTPFTNEYGNDVTLDDRRRDYFFEYINFCDENCTFLGYNISSGRFSCECYSSSASQNKEIITKELPSDFYENHTLSNLQIIKCYSQVFSLKGQLTKNIGSYALAGCFVSFIVVAVFYFVKGRSQIDKLFADINNNNLANPPKVEPTDNSNPDSKRRSVNNQEKDKEIISDDDLNHADYEDAKKDERSFIQLYWSLVKMKQLIIFTFYTYTDHNLRVVKVGLFILFISFYIAFTALFFNDDLVKKLYIDKGKISIIVHIPNIIYSSVACLIMNLIIKCVSLSTKDLIKAKKDKNSVDKIKKCIKIKTAILFCVSAVLIILSWYYVSAFCSVFKNSQGQYFLNVAGAFIICNIWPFITSLLAPPLRIYGIKHESPCAYKASQIISYI